MLDEGQQSPEAKKKTALIFLLKTLGFVGGALILLACACATCYRLSLGGGRVHDDEVRPLTAPEGKRSYSPRRSARSTPR